MPETLWQGWRSMALQRNRPKSAPLFAAAILASGRNARGEESNPRPATYKDAALPTELLRQMCCGSEYTLTMMVRAITACWGSIQLSAMCPSLSARVLSTPPQQGGNSTP